MSDSSTPLASSRRPARLSISARTRGAKSVHWRLTPEMRPPPTRREPTSPTDLVGRLSLAQSTTRNLRQQLAERDEELQLLREEKEKYEAEHGKLYSQMAAVRSRSQAFEAQLAKKALECEALQERCARAEEDCAKLRGLTAGETSKQTLRVKNLEAHVRALKAEIEAQLAGNTDFHIASLREENLKLKEALQSARGSYKKELEEILGEREAVAVLTEDLTKRLEEARTAMLKLSTEKTVLIQDIQRLKEERKPSSRKEQRDLALDGELQLRLAELETERSNAKTALKKAMAVFDQNEKLQKELEAKDAKIAELERLLRQRLPSMEILDASLAKMNIAQATSGAEPKSPETESIQTNAAEEKALSAVPPAHAPASETNILARIGEIRSRLGIASRVESRFAVPSKPGRSDRC